MNDLSDEEQLGDKNRVTLNGHALSLIERAVLELSVERFLNDIQDAPPAKIKPGWKQACINILEKMKQNS